MAYRNRLSVKYHIHQIHTIWEFLFSSDPRVTPAKSKSTRPFIWKTHMIGRVDLDLAAGGDMSMLEIDKIVNFLRWSKGLEMVKMVENASMELLDG